MTVLPITPQTRVGDFLNNYPEQEELLLSLSPAFNKLRNPVLRRTIGRVATFQQIAVVGNIPLDEIINTLRKATGQTQNFEETIMQNDLTQKPDWFATEHITDVLDAREMLQAGQHPLAEVLSKTSKMPEGQIFELITPFVPMPLIEKITASGLKAYISETGSAEFHSYFYK